MFRGGDIDSKNFSDARKLTGSGSYTECCDEPPPLELELDEFCETACPPESGAPCVGIKFKKCGDYTLKISTSMSTPDGDIALSGECSGTKVEVSDPYGPEITCPADVVKQCSFVEADVGGPATATDNCNDVTISNTGDLPSCAAKSVPRKWTATGKTLCGSLEANRKQPLTLKFLLSR